MNLPDSSVTTDVGPYARVPLWLLDALADQPSAGSALRVWCALFRWADRDKGTLWPSQKTIADKAGVSLTVCREALARLQALGALEVTHRMTDQGDPDTNFYHLLLARPPSAIRGRGPLDFPREGSPGYPTTNQSHVEQESTEPDSSPAASKAVALSVVPPPERKRSEKDDLWDAVCLACGIDASGLTKSERADVGKTCKEVWDAGGRAADVAPRVAEWSSRYSETVPTHRVLRQWWASLASSYKPPSKAAGLAARAKARRQAGS